MPKKDPFESIHISPVMDDAEIEAVVRVLKSKVLPFVQESVLKNLKLNSPNTLGPKKQLRSIQELQPYMFH